MERSLLSYPIRSRIMSEIISVPIETYVMKVRAIMCSTVSPIMIRQTEVEQTTIRIIHINPETPSSAGNINRAVEIISSQKPTILCITQYPAKIVITDIQRFIIIIQCPFVTTCYVIHDITDRINKVVINLIRIIILLSAQTQFVCHFISKKACFLTHFASAHSSHHCRTDSQPDSKE